jgi:phytoene dehydrogenase-like protein
MTDAIIIGGGHNGLVCAWYLARAGLSVRVLERRGLVGGAAVTEEFHPGFRNSTASYTVSLLNRQVMADMALAEHGLRIVERPLSNFLPLQDGYLELGGGLARTQEQFRKFSARDAERLPDYYAALERVAGVLRDLAGKTPPNAGGGWLSLIAAAQQGGRLAKLPLDQQRDALDLFTKSAREFLDGWFESAPVKAVFGFDAVVGSYASPDTPGSAYVLLHHVWGEMPWGHAIGGMGAITQAMRQACEAAGVDIETDAPVAQVLVAGGAAVGVTLEDGRELRAPRIIANVGPKLLYEKLVAPDALPADFRRRIAGYRIGSGTLRMNVALSELPRFTVKPEPGPHLSSGIIIAPSMDYMDWAFIDARATGMSIQPIVEMLIPSTLDDTLAPPGRHVASLFCQHFAPDADWDALRETAADRVIDTVNAHAPNFKASIIARQVHTPLDLERKFGLTAGDIFHGALGLDQLWAARPVLGHGSYRGPLKGLYMCGSGTHPGGGVTGLPGRNAAREILKDCRWRLGRQ